MPDAAERYSKPPKLTTPEPEVDRLRRMLISVLVRLDVYGESVEGFSLKDFMTREVVEFWRTTKLDTARGVRNREIEEANKGRLERLMNKMSPNDREILKAEFLKGREGVREAKLELKKEALAEAKAAETEVPPQ